MYTKIMATGSYIPDTQIDNKDLIQFPKGSLQLIESKTGIKTRYHAQHDEATSDLAAAAARVCLSEVDFDPQDLDAVIIATSSPDRMQPPTATRVQHLIGARRAFAFDINAVCSGGVYAVHLADMMIKSGICFHILIVAAEVYSRILNSADISTYPYFGDGAAAVLFSGSDKPGVVTSILHSDGAGADLISVPAGGTMLPYNHINHEKELYFKMRGRDVFNFAVSKAPEVIRELLDRANLTIEQVKYIIPHQANVNIIKAIAEDLQIDLDRFVVNLDRYGNTAAASTIIALDELVRSDNLETGDYVILVAFGGGLAWGANLIIM